MNNDKMSWSAQMRDARYLRAQAELCLEMARQVSDQTTSDNLRAEAARYQAEVAEIEDVGAKGTPGAELIPRLKGSMSALVKSRPNSSRTGCPLCHQ